MSSTDADSAARSRSRPQSQSPSAKRRIERSDLGTPAASKSDLNLPTNRPREPSVDKTVLDKSDSDARTPAHTLDAQSDEDEDVEHIDSDTPASQSPTRATIRRRTKPAPVSPRSLDQPPSEEDSKESHSPQPQSPGAESPAPRSPAMRSPAPHTPHAPQTPRSPLLPGSQAPGDRSSSSDQSVAVGVGRKTHWLTIASVCACVAAAVAVLYAGYCGEDAVQRLLGDMLSFHSGTASQTATSKHASSPDIASSTASLSPLPVRYIDLAPSPHVHHAALSHLSSKTPFLHRVPLFESRNDNSSALTAALMQHAREARVRADASLSRAGATKTARVLESPLTLPLPVARPAWHWTVMRHGSREMGKNDTIAAMSGVLRAVLDAEEEDAAVGATGDEDDASASTLAQLEELLGVSASSTSGISGYKGIPDSAASRAMQWLRGIGVRGRLSDVGAHEAGLAGERLGIEWAMTDSGIDADHLLGKEHPEFLAEIRETDVWDVSGAAFEWIPDRLRSRVTTAATHKHRAQETRSLFMQGLARGLRGAVHRVYGGRGVAEDATDNSDAVDKLIGVRVEESEDALVKGDAASVTAVAVLGSKASCLHAGAAVNATAHCRPEFLGDKFGTLVLRRGPILEARQTHTEICELRADNGAESSITAPLVSQCVWERSALRFFEECGAAALDASKKPPEWAAYRDAVESLVGAGVHSVLAGDEDAGEEDAEDETSVSGVSASVRAALSRYVRATVQAVLEREVSVALGGSIDVRGEEEGSVVDELTQWLVQRVISASDVERDRAVDVDAFSNVSPMTRSILSDNSVAKAVMEMANATQRMWQLVRAAERHTDAVLEGVFGVRAAQLVYSLAKLEDKKAKKKLKKVKLAAERDEELDLDAEDEEDAPKKKDKKLKSKAEKKAKKLMKLTSLSLPAPHKMLAKPVSLKAVVHARAKLLSWMHKLCGAQADGLFSADYHRMLGSLEDGMGSSRMDASWTGLEWCSVLGGPALRQFIVEYDDRYGRDADSAASAAEMDSLDIDATVSHQAAQAPTRRPAHSSTAATLTAAVTPPSHAAPTPAPLLLLQAHLADVKALGKKGPYTNVVPAAACPALREVMDVLGKEGEENPELEKEKSGWSSLEDMVFNRQVNLTSSEFSVLRMKALHSGYYPCQNSMTKHPASPTAVPSAAARTAASSAAPDFALPPGWHWCSHTASTSASESSSSFLSASLSAYAPSRGHLSFAHAETLLPVLALLGLGEHARVHDGAAHTTRSVHSGATGVDADVHARDVASSPRVSVWGGVTGRSTPAPWNALHTMSVFQPQSSQSSTTNASSQYYAAGVLAPMAGSVEIVVLDCKDCVSPRMAQLRHNGSPIPWPIADCSYTAVVPVLTSLAAAITPRPAAPQASTLNVTDVLQRERNATASSLDVNNTSKQTTVRGRGDEGVYVVYDHLCPALRVREYLQQRMHAVGLSDCTRETWSRYCHREGYAGGKGDDDDD